MLAAAVFALTVALALVTGVCGVLNVARLGSEGHLENLLTAIPAVAFAFVGHLIVRRRPGHRVGELCLAGGLLLAALAASTTASAWTFTAEALPVGVANWIAWFGWVWVPMTGVVGIHLPLRVPDGHLVSPRWRWYSRTSTALIVLVSVWSMTDPGPFDELPGFTNPTTATWRDPLGPLLYALPVFLIGALGSLVVRYRRAEVVERQQIRCIAYGIAWFVATFGFGFVAVEHVRPLVPFLLVTGMTAVPVSIGVAVLRYRLYDIDRLISRTVSYALLTGVLGAVYAATVVLLGTLQAGSELSVAGSTLVVAALFGPVRRWVQARVDRRFNRARYDAEQTVQAFAAVLRDEVDIDELSAALLETVHETVQPARASLWLRPAGSITTEA
jgi:hypothetical protein